MSKAIRQIAILFGSFMLVFMVGSMTSFAGDSDDILLHNKAFLDGQQKEIVEGYDLKNDWANLKLLNPVAPGNPTGPDNTWQYLDETGTYENIGYFVPEKLNMSYLDGLSYRAGSIGVTGSEIEKFEQFAVAMGAGDKYKNIKYPESDMSIAGESNKVYLSSSDGLDKASVRVTSDLSSFKLWNEFANNGNTASIKTTFNVRVNLILTLPEELSFISDDIKSMISTNNPNYTVEAATVSGKEVSVKLIKEIKNANVSDFGNNPDNFLDIDLDISGIKFNDLAKLGQTYTIKGSLFGLLDNMDKENAAPPALLVNTFATKQSVPGKDEASNLGSIMAISVGVKNNTVTFKNDNSNDINVLVENGRAIENDIDKSQSMPANPTKDGYVFKGWNTQKDGKGDSFTGDTVVNENLTVYAIFDKKTSTTNSDDNAGKNPGNSNGLMTSPKTSDSSNIIMYVELLAVSTALLVINGMRRKNIRYKSY